MPNKTLARRIQFQFWAYISINGTGSTNRNASNRGHNASANKSGPDTIQGAVGEVYSEQVVSKYPKVSESLKGGYANFAKAVGFS